MARTKISEAASRETCEKGAVKPFRSSLPSSKDGVSGKKYGLVSSVPDHLRKRKEVQSSRTFNIGPNKSQKMMQYGKAGKKKLEVNDPREAGRNKVGLYEARKAPVKPGRMVLLDRKHNKTDSFASKEPGSEILVLDIDSQRRVLGIMKKSTEEISMESVIKKYKNPYRYSNSTRNAFNKTITMGKVKRSVQAIKTAVKRLDEGGNIEDAKAVCEPEVLSQILEWKVKLQVYLAPLLHGARYTTFGRHFTKPDKLQQIVDRLHWYAKDGDMIVDFCCGANDFSPLMKAKLEELGKECSYKTFDLFQAKNDFNFERRDWMTVKNHELEIGSRLIMGLSPRFGGNRVNGFVAKALHFRPKILILILRCLETESFLNKRGYELIWKDDYFLCGQPFYLPGSVSNYGNSLDSWNKGIPLSLWSRSDFAVEHRKIAEEHEPFHLARRMQPEERQSRPGSSRSSRDIYTVRQSPANMGQNPCEAFEPIFGGCVSHFNDGLLAKYSGVYSFPPAPTLSIGYLPRNSGLLDPMLAPPPPSLMDSTLPVEQRYAPHFDEMNYQRMNLGYLTRYSGLLDPMLAPPPPSLMDNTLPVEQRYAPHFDEMNYQRMNSFPPQPPIQPSGHNIYKPSGFPLQLPPPGDFGYDPNHHNRWI